MPDVQELGNTLRKALDNTRRTAQSHLKAVQDAEAAILAYERALAEQAEDLVRERGALEEERRTFESERNQIVDDLEGLDEVEEYAVDEVENQREVLESDRRLHVKPTYGGAGLHNGASHGRARDRSRSRERSGSGRPLDSVRAKVTSLGLDGTASRQIQQFPTQQALSMLDQVPDDVRNPSAFVTKMCQRALQPKVDVATPEFDRVEAAVLDFGLDESAARVLRELPNEQAISILDQVDGSVRNPSAFIMSWAHRSNRGKGKSSGAQLGPSMEERVETHTRRLGLDTSALRMINELSPEQSLSILEQVSDDVRNPSAYVTAEVRKLLPGAAKGRHDSGAKAATSAPRELREFVQQIDHLAKQLDLDGSCVDALHNITPQDAVQILERLATDISTIRNRSAFVFAEVKKRRQAPAASAAPVRSHAAGGGSGGRGDVRSIPCKFFAEGRCKNGPDCRFSHV